MAAERGRTARHDGASGSANVGGQGMALRVGGQGVVEDRLERDERHRDLNLWLMVCA